MLTCVPQSLCSWDFRILGAAGGPAYVTFNFFTEQGTIGLGSEEYQVVKHGPLSGHWTLERNGATFADAQKESALFRCFEMCVSDIRFTVKAESPLTRCYEILRGDGRLGSIRPAHPMTRRAFVECDMSVPELALLFAFWLAVLTWRRAANSNS